MYSTTSKLAPQYSEKFSEDHSFADGKLIPIEYEKENKVFTKGANQKYIVDNGLEVDVYTLEAQKRRFLVFKDKKDEKNDRLLLDDEQCNQVTRVGDKYYLFYDEVISQYSRKAQSDTSIPVSHRMSLFLKNPLLNLESTSTKKGAIVSPVALDEPQIPNLHPSTATMQTVNNSTTNNISATNNISTTNVYQTVFMINPSITFAPINAQQFPLGNQQNYNQPASNYYTTENPWPSAFAVPVNLQNQPNPHSIISTDPINPNYRVIESNRVESAPHSMNNFNNSSLHQKHPGVDNIMTQASTASMLVKRTAAQSLKRPCKKQKTSGNPYSFFKHTDTSDSVCQSLTSTNLTRFCDVT